MLNEPGLKRELDAIADDFATWSAECYRIRDKHGQIVPYRLNRIQQAIGAAEAAQLEQQGRARNYVLKARQGGVSTDQQARNLYQIWEDPGFDALSLAHTREDTDMLFEITQRAIEHFPPQLLPRLGGKEAREISFPELDSHFYTRTAGAKRSGRGMTLKRFHGSEFAFWDTPRATLSAITPALVPDGSVGTLETTASGFDSEGHQFWQEAEAGANGWTPLFFPWWECDPEHYRLPLFAPDELGTLADDERTLMELFGLTPEQIKWRRQQMRDIGRAEFFREYPEDAQSCWLAAGGLYYEADVLQDLMRRAPEPREIRRNGTLRIFGDPAPGDVVVLGGDTAEGVGGDASTFVARGHPSGRLLVEFADNTIQPDPFADLVNEWGRRFGLAFLVLEKNLHGITVIRRLRDHHRYPIARIYHRAAQDRDQTPAQQSTDRIGWHTSAETKPLLLNAGYQLLQSAYEGLVGCPSKACLRDAYAVRRNDSGSAELTGRDVLVAEMLSWIGRAQPRLTATGALITL